METIKLNKSMISEANKAANKLTSALADGFSIANGTAHRAVVDANNKVIDRRRALSELAYTDLWSALRTLNAMCQKISDTEIDYYGEAIEVSGDAPAKELCKLLRLLNFKKFRAMDLLLFPMGSDLLWAADSRSELVTMSLLCGTSELCTIVKRHGRFEAKSLSRNGLYRVQDIALSIFARYADEISKYNAKLTKALRASNGKAISTANSALYAGTAQQFSDALASSVHKKINQQLNELSWEKSEKVADGKLSKRVLNQRHAALRRAKKNNNLGVAKGTKNATDVASCSRMTAFAIG